MTSIYNYDPEQFEKVFKNVTTKEYMDMWNRLHKSQFKMARQYVTDIRNAQHAASSEAIRQILA